MQTIEPTEVKVHERHTANGKHYRMLLDDRGKFILVEITEDRAKWKLCRIENKTYGIDRETGALIPKERLRAVPHATLSVASKEARKQ